jgi:hypothetical protein
MGEELSLDKNIYCVFMDFFYLKQLYFLKIFEFNFKIAGRKN